MSGRRSTFDIGIDVGATPHQGQMRYFGALLVAGSLAALGFVSVFFTEFPAQATAASVTVLLGGVGATFAFGMGLLVFVPAAWSAEETGWIILTIIVGLACALGLQWLIRFLPNPPPLLLYSVVPIIGAALTVAVAPFEELFCRGFLQTLLYRVGGPKMGAVLGIGGGGMLFATFHLRIYLLGPGFWAMLVVGAVIGVAYYLVPFIEVPIMIHLLMNLFAVMLVIPL